MLRAVHSGATYPEKGLNGMEICKDNLKIGFWGIVGYLRTMEGGFQWEVEDTGDRYQDSPYWMMVIGIKGDTSKYTDGQFRFALSITISEGIRFAHVS